MNLNYSMSGDVDLAPVNAWDDRQLRFQIPGNRTSPPSTSSTGRRESIAARHSTGASSDIVVVTGGSSLGAAARHAGPGGLQRGLRPGGVVGT